MNHFLKKLGSLIGLSLFLITCGPDSHQQNQTHQEHSRIYKTLQGTWSFEDLAVKDSSGNDLYYGDLPHSDFLTVLSTLPGSYMRSFERMPENLQELIDRAPTFLSRIQRSHPELTMRLRARLAESPESYFCTLLSHSETRSHLIENHPLQASIETIRNLYRNSTLTFSHHTFTRHYPSLTEEPSSPERIEYRGERSVILTHQDETREQLFFTIQKNKLHVLDSETGSFYFIYAKQ